MDTARAAHTATLLPDGTVLIAGGFGGRNDTYYASTELYDPAARALRPLPPMGARRAAHTATLLADGRVLLAGGFDGEYLASAELFDPATGRFMPTGPMTTARSDHEAVRLADGRVLVVGGVGAGWSFLDSAELFDPATGTFTSTGAMVEARESHTLTLLLDGRALVTGGHRGRHAAITIYDSAELYDPATGRFTPTGSMTLARHKHDAVRLPDGSVLLSGGADARDDVAPFASTERYDPATGRFAALAEMPQPRYKHRGTSVLLPNGQVLLAGGAATPTLYDPPTNTFRTVEGTVGRTALTRLFATATLLATGDVLILGGYGRTEPTSAGAWLYRPSNTSITGR